MNEREGIIRLWFDMWLCQKDLGIDEIFTEDVTYIVLYPIHRLFHVYSILQTNVLLWNDLCI